jgi:hypothetical protein
MPCAGLGHRKAKMAAPPGARQDNDLMFCQPDERPWLPDHVRSGDGTRQRGRKRVLSGTDVPRMFPTAAILRTSQPGQITGFRR